MKKLLGFVLAGSLFACAHAPVRLDRERADAYAAVKAAEEAGAARYSRAAWHLKYARDRLAAADDLLDDGEGVRAKRALEEAIVDGQLATRMVEEAQLAERLDRAQDRATALQAEARAEASSLDDDDDITVQPRAEIEIEAEEDGDLEVEIDD